MEGDIESIYRQRLAGLTEQCEKALLIGIENNLMLGENEKAYEQLKVAYSVYPEDERVYMLLGQYFRNIRDYDSFEKMVRHLRDNHINKSHEGKD